MTARAVAAPVVALVAGLVTACAPADPALGATEPRDGSLAARLARTISGSDTMPPRWPRAPLLDVATEMTNIATLRRMPGWLGAGAAVCIVDGGVDLAHRDFRDAEDRTRVLELLDLEAPPRGAHPELEARFGGAVWTSDDLDGAVETLPIDSTGHGTAVASAAVGDDAPAGVDEPGPRAGAAPQAGLVVVRAVRAGARGYTDESIATGVEFCFAAGPPGQTVAVVPLGGHDGRHDGTEPLELALDEQSVNGPVVVAAGNEGDVTTHAWGRLRPDERAVVDVVVPAPDPASLERQVSLSVAGASTLAIELEAPDATTTGPVRAGERVESSHDRGALLVDGTLGERRAEGPVLYAIVGGDAAHGTPLGGGTYHLIVRGEGRFDAWIIDADVGDAVLPARLAGPFAHASSTVTIPATARSVIAVGATVSRPALETRSGSLVVEGEPGAIAPFSSTGPTPDGRPKPEIVAPGGALSVALSADVDPDDPASLYGGSRARFDRMRIADDRIAVRGTSFAAPLVAGLLAAALARVPYRGVSDVDTLLFGATPIEGAGPWTASGGFGALDALAFATARTRTSSSPVDPAASAIVPTGPVDVGTPYVWLAGRVVTTDGAPWSGTVEIDDTTFGTQRVQSESGVVRARIGAPRGGVGDRVMLSVFADGARLPPITLAYRRDAARDLEPPDPRGGACISTVAAGRRGDEWIAVAALLALVALGVRRTRRAPRPALTRPCRGSAGSSGRLRVSRPRRGSGSRDWS